MFKHLPWYKMKLLQQVNNIVENQIHLIESGATLAANLRATIDDDATMSEDRAHAVAKIIVMWNIIKKDVAILHSALTYDIICTILQRALTNSNKHSSLSNDIKNIANHVYGNPKNITKMQRYLAKLLRQIDNKVEYKVRAMNIASHLLHRDMDPKIKHQLLQSI
jgi:hypothetical protein